MEGGSWERGVGLGYDGWACGMGSPTGLGGRGMRLLYRVAEEWASAGPGDGDARAVGAGSWIGLESISAFVGFHLGVFSQGLEL